MIPNKPPIEDIGAHTKKISHGFSRNLPGKSKSIEKRCAEKKLLRTIQISILYIFVESRPTSLARFSVEQKATITPIPTHTINGLILIKPNSSGGIAI